MSPVRRALAVVATATAVLSVLALAPAAPAGAAPTPATGPDPGGVGPHTVDELTYDLGDEAFRPTGFPGAVELRGKVYAPTTITGEAPLVVMMHGRHVTCASDEDLAMQWPCPATIPEVPSYQGYDALGRLLASHGAIVVSIGANGINAVDGYTADAGMAARGQLTLEHLRLWAQWDVQSGGPFGSRFVGHVDTGAIGLMGHSRGGEGVVTAAVMNQRRTHPYGIAAVVALAPVDFLRPVLGGVPLQVVLPFCDGDVFDLQGATFYDDARDATPGDLAPKQTTLLWGANHNFFNTVWTSGPGSFDDADFFDEGGTGATDACASSGPGRLSGPQQATAGATLMGGFLRRHLFDDDALEPFVTGVSARPASLGGARYAVAHHGADRLDLGRWASPADTGLNRQLGPLSVLSASPGTVCQAGYSFDGYGWDSPPCPADGATVGSTNVLDVGWTERTAAVRSTLPTPGGADVTDYDGVRFRVAFPPDWRNDGRPRQGASVRIVDATGSSSTVAVGEWSPAFALRPASAIAHSVLNGVRVPLSAFSGVDLTRVRSVEVLFDRTDSGRALLSDLALTREGTGDSVGPADGAGTGPVEAGWCTASRATLWACAVGAVVWGRPPVLGPETSALVTAHRTPAARATALTTALANATAARTALEEAVQVVLGMGLTDDDLGYYLATSGGSWERALATLVADAFWSPPIASDAGRAADRLFLALLGRLPSTAARDYWAQRIQAQGPRAATLALLGTPERADRVVVERYRQVLGWTPAAAGRDYWVARVRRQGGEKALLHSLLRSEAFTSDPR